MLCGGVRVQRRRRARDVVRRPLINLLAADRAPETMRLGGRALRAGQGVLAACLLAVVWGSCVFQPVYFIAFIIPMGLAACFATALVARLGVARWAAHARASESRYWDGLRAFTVRQVEARVSSSSMALACVCVLIAVGLCMMVAGFAFSVGLRTPEMLSSGIAASMAPIGYIGIFYGAVFLLSAVAVLALQQLSGAEDARRAYCVLMQLGCEHADMRRSLRSQVRLYFVAPLVGALIHDVFGLFLVGFLTFALGVQGFFAIVGGVLTFVVVLMGVVWPAYRPCGGTHGAEGVTGGRARLRGRARALVGVSVSCRLRSPAVAYSRAPQWRDRSQIEESYVAGCSKLRSKS